MALAFGIILFASVACYSPGFAQLVVPYYGAPAYASANAVAGYTPNAYSYAYAYVYPPYRNRVPDCTYDRCTPTCSRGPAPDCPQNSNPCNCPEGTVISDQGGQCVPELQCERYRNCNGDYNAEYMYCPNPCPATCANYDNRNCYTKQCPAPGCVCKFGYLLSSINGKCIKAEQCPGGNVCRQNETLVNCLVDCPNLYCPVDETRVACGPVQPCPTACACKNGYLWKSVNDRTCILSSECPPGKCYGPNMEWNRCVSPCVSDQCKDRNKVSNPGDCPFSPSECYPRCLCKKGFLRNDQFECVPAQECPAAN